MPQYAHPSAAFVANIGGLLRAAAPVADDAAHPDDLRRLRNDAATVAVKKAEAALAYRRIYTDIVAKAADGIPDFVEQIQLATAEYNARLMASLPESVRGTMLTYLEDLQIATVRAAEEFQATADIALRARQADDAARAWIDLAKENADLLPQIRAQIRDFVAAQQLDPKAAAAFEQALLGNVLDAALLHQSTTRPEQFLADRESGRWEDVAPERLALAAAQAAQVLALKKRKATAEAATRAVGLQARVQYAVDIYRGGMDFPGYAALARELQATGQTALLLELDESRSDLGYAVAQQSSTPELLQQSRADNLQRAETAGDPSLARLYRRHAAIDGAALRSIAGIVQRDPLTFAVGAAIVPPTEVVAPIFETAATGDDAVMTSAVGERMAARKQVETHYGAPVGFFTPEERQDFVATYTALPGPKEKFALLRSLSKLPEAITKEIGEEVEPIAEGNEIPIVLNILRDDPAQAYDVITGLAIIRRHPGIIPEKTNAFGHALETRYKKYGIPPPEDPLQERTAITALYAAMLYNIRGAYKGTRIRDDIMDIAFAQVAGSRAPPPNA